MPNKPFEFLPENDIDVAKYEYVEFKSNSMRNIVDYHDMESYLKYRFARAVHDLFGNMRIVGNESQQEPISISGNKITINNELFYFDGYRIKVDNLESEDIVFENNKIYDIYLCIDYKLITKDDEPRIALTDKNTGSMIETSYRYKFDYEIKAIVSTASFTCEKPVYYKIAFITVDGNGNKTISHTNSEVLGLEGILYSDVDKKYQEAIDIINSAIHTGSDGITNIDSILSIGNKAGIRFDVKKDNNDNLKLQMKDENGNIFGGIEAYKNGDIFYPVIWLQNSDSDYPTAVITPTEYKIFYGNSRKSIVSPSKLFVGDLSNNLSFGDKVFGVKILGHDAIKSTVAYQSIEETYLSVDRDSENQDSTISDGSYEKLSLVDNSHNAIYTVNIDDNTNNNNVYTINHKIYAGNSFDQSYVSFSVEVKDSHGNVLGYKSYKLNESQVVEDSVDFVFTNKTSATQTVTIKYFINEESATIGFKTGQNISYLNIDGAIPVTEFGVMHINDYDVYLTDGGYFNVKSNPSYNATITSEVISGENVATIGKHELDKVAIEVTNSDDVNAPQYDASTQKLLFPMASNEDVSAGLLSHSEYSALMGAEYSTRWPQASDAISFVSHWSGNNVNDKQYNSTFGEAISYLNSLGTSEATITVYPRTYNESISISTSNKTKINIIGLDKERSIISGDISIDKDVALLLEKLTINGNLVIDNYSTITLNNINITGDIIINNSCNLIINDSKLNSTIKNISDQSANIDLLINNSFLDGSNAQITIQDSSSRNINADIKIFNTKFNATNKVPIYLSFKDGSSGSVGTLINNSKIILTQSNADNYSAVYIKGNGNSNNYPDVYVFSVNSTFVSDPLSNAGEVVKFNNDFNTDYAYVGYDGVVGYSSGYSNIGSDANDLFDGDDSSLHYNQLNDASSTKKSYNKLLDLLK